MDRRTNLCILGCVLSLVAAGCFKTNEVTGLKRPKSKDAGAQDEPETPSTAGRGPGNPVDAGKPQGPNDPVSQPAGRCVLGGYCAEIEIQAPRSADLLFVVDNSGSMRQEQAALREQFPKLIQVLVTGLKSSGERFPPLRDLHLGVVSSDMGLAGIPNNFPGCNTQRHINGGDDGVLLHPGNTGPGCQAEYPPWLAYTQGKDDPQKTAANFGCIAALGTTGCGFEQQLEAGLKALWPKNYVDADGNVYPPEKNPILFLSTTNEGRFGHGDVPVTQGGNGGFLRANSLVAIVIVTDEEDCSSKNTGHFLSTNDPANPLSKQGINLRCFYNKQNLFEIDRYVKGYQGLRPGREEDVLFAAIVGVPKELVSAEARASVNFSDQKARDEFYDNILGDTRMVERPMNESVPAIANVAPSCSRTDSLGERADAYPPRRMVEVAKGFGQNAVVQSICQDDFGPALDAVIDLTSTRTKLQCLPRELRRGSNGKIDCELLWELPKDGSSCKDLPFLSAVSSPRAKTNDRGGPTCKVAQLAITTLGQEPSGQGFFYDDFTDERAGACVDSSAARIAYSSGIEQPQSVRAVLDCSKKAE
ncbi:MAG TPA: hypothetical protein VJV78_30645 [Polyangiales bacterium]|nr:hypothetical protein [Polyangiales bacterium]